RGMAVFLEVAATNRDYLYSQPSQLTKVAPHRCEIELTLGRGIGKNGHQIPVTVRTVSSPGAAAEQPDLLGLEHFDDALDDARWDGYGYHRCGASEFWNGGQAHDGRGTGCLPGIRADLRMKPVIGDDCFCRQD